MNKLQNYSNNSTVLTIKVTPGALWKMQRNGKYLVWQFYGVMCSYIANNRTRL